MINAQRLLNHRTILSIALVLTASGFAALGGCAQGDRYASYPYHSDSDYTFERGADRPPTAQTLYRTARILAAQGKEDQAEDVLRTSIERYPSYVPSYCELAQLQIQRRQVDAALDTLGTALSRGPNDPVVHNAIGICRMLRGEYRAALDSFQTAADAAPSDARYRANVAMALGLLGRYDESLDTYLEVVSPAQAHYNVGVLSEARNNHRRADDEFARAATLDPKMRRTEN